MANLLSRDEFRESVFRRDGQRCVVCQKPAVDAHHILERRLFPDGGYYIENGASVCEQHHLEAEMTVLPVEQLSRLIGARERVLPPHLSADERYDKWGNILLSDGRRLRGDLFYDESVQKILKQGGVLELFSAHVKYPRTFHLPWSPGISSDDRVLDSTTQFEGMDIVVTLKMDGENISMYRDHIHSRSLEFRRHESRAWIKAFHAERANDIPEGWRICGESLYAKHSIGYQSLPSYFLGFSIWDQKNRCLAWSETLEYFALLDIHPVPTLYRGLYDEALLRDLYQAEFEGDECEGYVLRLSEEFFHGEFRRAVGKYVRRAHAQTGEDWLRQAVVKNGLKG